jgi:hypothetical protein
MAAWARLTALLLACCAPLATAATAELRPFQASYSISWNGISAGNGELELHEISEGVWSYQLRILARGFLARLAMPAELDSRSIFSLQDGRIVPQQFTAEDGARSSSRDQHLHFDWVRGRVTGTAERKPVDLPTQPGLLDSLSVQVALMRELQAGRTPQRFVLVDKDRIKDYVYTTEGTDTLRTAAGEFHTVIYRSTRVGSKKSTWFWCAPELGYLPLKVETREGTDVELTMAVKSFTGKGAAG